MILRDRMKLIGVVSVGIVIAGLPILFHDAKDQAMCRTLYAAARTAVDTAQIDRRSAPAERGSGELAGAVLHCGDLRRRWEAKQTVDDTTAHSGARAE